MINKLKTNTGLLIVSVALTLLSVLVAVTAGWTTTADISPLEVLATSTSYFCTLLFVVERRLAYPVGVVTTALYTWLFFKWGLPAVAIFNLYLVFSLAYGWLRWGPDNSALPVTKLGLFDVWWLAYVAIGLGVYGFLKLVNNYFGFEMGQLDVTVAVLSGVAQFMLDNKRIQNWIVWLVIDLLSLYLFFNQGLFLVTFQYVFFTANAFWGFYEWNRSYNKRLKQQEYYPHFLLS